MTRREALERLAHATGKAIQANELSVYLERLGAYPEAAVVHACRQLETSATWFPKLAEVAELARSATRSLPAPHDDNPQTWRRCPTCDDLGWDLRECAGGDRRTCGRPDKSRHVNGIFWSACQSAHTYAERCVCQMIRDGAA